MYILGIVMLFAVGYLTVFNISTATTRLERVGLAFPVGVGVVTFVMALMDLVRIPLTPAALITADFVLTAALVSVLAVRRQKVLEAFKRPARQIVDEVLAVLEHSSPELVADIAQTGIVLTGGGSLLYGFDKLISERTEIACSIADDADSCVANGCGRSLQWISSMQEGTINLARRKLMKEQ